MKDMGRAKRPKCSEWNKRWPHRKCKNDAEEGSTRCGTHRNGGLTEQQARALRARGRAGPKIAKPRSASTKPRPTAARRAVKLLQKRLEAELKKRRKHRATLRKKQERQREKDRQKIQAASDFCLSVAEEGLVSASASKITDCVEAETSQLLRRTWKAKRCKRLARIAEGIKKAKKVIHGWFADLIVKVIWQRPEQLFVRQLLTHVPLPGDEQLNAAINAIRVVGVSLCFAQGIRLTECECFKTLAIEHTKERVKAILISAGDKWLSLNPPTDSR